MHRQTPESAVRPSRAVLGRVDPSPSGSDGGCPTHRKIRPRQNDRTIRAAHETPTFLRRDAQSLMTRRAIERESRRAVRNVHHSIPLTGAGISPRCAYYTHIATARPMATRVPQDRQRVGQRDLVGPPRPGRRPLLRTPDRVSVLASGRWTRTAPRGTHAPRPDDESLHGEGAALAGGKESTRERSRSSCPSRDATRVRHSRSAPSRPSARSRAAESPLPASDFNDMNL